MSDYDNTRYYWLQLKEDFFEDDAIQWLEDQPNGCEQAYFYLKLCIKSLKSSGLLIRRVGEMVIPYDAERLAKLTGTPVNTVQAAIVNLKMCGLVQVLDDGTLYMTQVETLVGSRSTGAFKKAQQRAMASSKRKLEDKREAPEALTAATEDECGQSGGQVSTKDRTRTRVRTRDRGGMGDNSAPVDEAVDEPLADDLIAAPVGSELDVVDLPPEPPACNEEKDQGSRMPPCPYDRIVTLYHEILPELPRVATLTSKRRSWITARWRSVCTTEKVASQADGLDLFRGYFSLVRKSPFLMGMKQPGKGHSRTFKADLEWLMNESNFTKVVEGKYA